MRAAAESDYLSSATQSSIDQVTGFRIDRRRGQVPSDSAWYTRCVCKTPEPNTYCSAIALVPFFYVHCLRLTIPAPLMVSPEQIMSAVGWKPTQKYTHSELNEFASTAMKNMKMLGKDVTTAILDFGNKYS